MASEKNMNPVQILQDPIEANERVFDYDDVYGYNSREALIQEHLDYVAVVLAIIVYIVVLVTDIFMIFVICKFKKLRKAKADEYVLHYFIVNTMLMISFLLTIIFRVCEFYTHVYMLNLWCVVHKGSYTAVILSLLIMFALIVDFYLNVFHAQCLTRHRKKYNFSIYCVYLVGVTQFAWSATFCYNRSANYLKVDPVTKYLIISFYVLITIPVIAFDIMKKFKNQSNRNEMTLTVLNVIVFSWMPLAIYLLLLPFFQEFIFIQYVLTYTIFIPILLWLGHTLILPWVLRNTNKHFKMAFNRCFKKGNSAYSDDLEEYSNDDDGGIFTNSVNVSSETETTVLNESLSEVNSTKILVF